MSTLGVLIALDSKYVRSVFSCSMYFYYSPGGVEINTPLDARQRREINVAKIETVNKCVARTQRACGTDRAQRNVKLHARWREIGAI